MVRTLLPLLLFGTALTHGASFPQEYRAALKLYDTGKFPEAKASLDALSESNSIPQALDRCLIHAAYCNNQLKAPDGIAARRVRDTVAAERDYRTALGSTLNDSKKAIVHLRLGGLRTGTEALDCFEEWESMTGHKWQTPTLDGENEYSKECGFHLKDATGTLYAVFGLLDQLGMRGYMPDEELGLIRPKHDSIRIPTQSLKKEPAYGWQRTRVLHALS
jgi:hypothetical protein